MQCMQVLHLLQKHAALSCDFTSVIVLWISSVNSIIIITIGCLLCKGLKGTIDHCWQMVGPFDASGKPNICAGLKLSRATADKHMWTGYDTNSNFSLFTAKNLHCSSNRCMHIQLTYIYLSYAQHTGDTATQHIMATRSQTISDLSSLSF